MNSEGIFNAVNNQLRAAVKRIGMGGYINSLSEGGPLLHKMNRRGNGVAFTNCSLFDGIHSKLQSDMTVLIIGDKIFEVGHKEQIFFNGLAESRAQDTVRSSIKEAKLSFNRKILF